MEREAFARAWQFLKYSLVAKWLALSSALLTAVLYVAFLMVLGLFADLMVNRGRIPAYRDLSAGERASFQRSWLEFRPEERKRRLDDLGIDDKSAEELSADAEKIDPQYKPLFWRTQIQSILQQRVSSVAAAYVLPEFRELPASVQSGFQQSWSALPEADRGTRLAKLGEQAAKVAALDPGKYTADLHDLIWRAHLYHLQKERSGEEVADAFWNDRFLGYGSDLPSGELPERELSDRGMLSLVVRNHEQLFAPLMGALARGCPWMWKAGSATRPNFYSYLVGLLILGLSLALLRALAMYTLNQAAAIASIEATNRLRRAVYHHTFRLGTLAVRALGPSEAVGIFTRQIETLHNGLYIWMTIMFREPVKFFLLLAFALALNVWLSIAFLIFALLVWLVGGQVAVYFKRQEREATRQAADELALLQESLMMMRLVKCYLMEPFNQSRVERQLSKYTVAQLRRYRGEAIYRPLLIFLGTLAAVVLFFVGGMIVLNGRLGIASAITLVAALVSLYLPLVNWLEHRRLIRKARESAVILFKFLDRPGEVGQVVGAEFLPPMTKVLEFENVSLQEPGTGRKLLQSVSLTIQAGQRVAIVGPDEMQKHALVYLIPRFLDPTNGEVRIDQHNLRWVTFDSLRTQIAMVLQHNLVFNDKVVNNIGCGDPSYDLPKIIDAAKMAHAHHFIQKLPRGYETQIGEMGHYLNVSEQFRIALARAILRDPAVLIVEEPTTALDDDTKALIDDTFTRVFSTRTVIFLPHRISTIRSCHRIFMLHKGKIEASGEHRELLAQNELYKHLHYIEFNEFAEQLL